MNKGILVIVAIIAISLIVYGAMAAQHNKTQANVDNKLTEVDAAAAHLVDVCNSVTDPMAKSECDSNIMTVWNTNCVDFGDKLSVCKENGPIEQYLKKAGYL